MLGTAIPGEGRWFQNSVVFGMKNVLKKVKKKFGNNSCHENCADEIEFHFLSRTLQLRNFSVC